MGRGEDGVELPALLDHEGERPHVLHHLRGDLAAVRDARALKDTKFNEICFSWNIYRVICNFTLMKLW